MYHSNEERAHNQARKPKSSLCLPYPSAWYGTHLFLWGRKALTGPPGLSVFPTNSLRFWPLNLFSQTILQFLQLNILLLFIFHDFFHCDCFGLLYATTEELNFIFPLNIFLMLCYLQCHYILKIVISCPRNNDCRIVLFIFYFNCIWQKTTVVTNISFTWNNFKRMYLSQNLFKRN